MYGLTLLPITLLTLATRIAAQTSTTCNPLKQSCPDDPALGTTFMTTFNESMSEFDPDLFDVEAGGDLVSFTSEGAGLSIVKQGDSVTVKTKFYIFFGQVTVMFKAAAGQGIISTFNMLSDDLDEIDVEIQGGNKTYTSTNYYGWGNTSQINTLYVPSTGGSWGDDGAFGEVHNYTLNWTPQQLEWIYDGKVVRTSGAGAAGQWPQTPSFLKFGIWAGGDPSLPKGTIAWAGGVTDYSKGPFTMTIQSIRMVDAHQNVKTYSYGDRSGDEKSIDITKGQSAAYNVINAKSTSQEIQDKWNGLSTTAKIGIGCGILGGLLLCAIAFTFYCIKERRAGKRERALADQAWDTQQAEMLEYRNRMKTGAFAVGYRPKMEKY